MRDAAALWEKAVAETEYGYGPGLDPEFRTGFACAVNSSKLP